ncbi:hypothetical protein P0136_08880 [Lentisphaerota bacterium ZTH]|nr:hypothetical protein JYG24_00015 [Lentisphaerota bacterium]WET05477.1 hypothetical protein P0136_08880 [Lentisphaerota bacterium ZTH]
MKLTKYLLLTMTAAAIGFGTTGCTSVNTNDGGNSVDVEKLKIPEYEAVVKHQPKKVTGQASIHVLFGLFSWGGDGCADCTRMGSMSFMSSSAEAKSAAVYNACKLNKADMILGSKYEIKSTDYFVYRKVNCKVTGYPANVTGIKAVK